MEEDLNYNGQTTTLPRRRRWYTRLWSSCLGCSCMKHQKKKKFVVYHNGYDPVGPLQRAATVGDLDTLERLIHSNEHHVDESDRRGRTSMHYACAHNHPEAVILLLENESNINIQDDEGSTPLIKATQQENVDCVSLLLSHNADPNLIDLNGNTAFHHAVSRGNIPIVKMLLEHNVDFEAKNRFGITPVELAAFNNKPEMVEFLETNYANARAMLNRTSKKRTEKRRLTHVRFKNEDIVFKDQRPLSCAVRSPGRLKSILKKPFQYETDSPPSLKASEKITRRTAVRSTKGDNVSYTSFSKQDHRNSGREAPAAIDPVPSTTAADSGAPDAIDTTFSTSADEETTLVRDLDDKLAPSQEAEVFFDASESIAHSDHCRTVVRAPDVLLAPRMLLLLLMPLIISNTSPWFLIFLLAVVTWMRNPFQQVWHEENGHGPPTNKTDEPVAAAADQYSLKKGSRPTV
uniref:ankyrin repeat domain-containing protein 26-like n=1 Tax=Arvicanthis niloticus TaxID=61156 RepID=UPI001486821F|nr:ankyrin repeat domain-containing protein 26-like [Arvicanthis niloticus]